MLRSLHFPKAGPSRAAVAHSGSRLERRGRKWARRRGCAGFPERVPKLCQLIPASDRSHAAIYWRRPTLKYGPPEVPNRVRRAKPRAPPQASHREENDTRLRWVAATAARGPAQHIQHDHNCEMAAILGTDGSIQPDKVPRVYEAFQRLERVSGVELLSDSRSDGEAGHELNTAPSLICQPGRD